MNTTSLPIKHTIKTAYILSLFIALLMSVSSLAGILYQDSLYPIIELRRMFVSNDVVNIFIGMPMLLISMWLTRRGSLTGLLFWPGALLYATYNYIAYAVAMPLTWPFALYLALVAMSIYTINTLLAAMDAAVIRQKLAGTVKERLTGGVLIGLGALFFLRSIGLLVTALSGPAMAGGPELAALAPDLLTTPLWIIGGVLLWRHKASGYVCTAGLLFQASMLFVGLLVFFILQPFMSGTPFPLVDFVVVFMMGLICFVPFGLYARGVLKT